MKLVESVLGCFESMYELDRAQPILSRRHEGIESGFWSIIFGGKTQTFTIPMIICQTMVGVTSTLDKRGRSSLPVVKIGTALGSSSTNTLEKKSFKALALVLRNMPDVVSNPTLEFPAELAC